MKKCFLILSSFLLIFTCSLFAERVYDSRGNLVRSSEWLPRSPKKEKVESEPVTVIEVVEEKIEAEEEPAVQEQQVMKEINIVADKVFNQKDIESSRCNNLPDFLQEKGFLVMASGGSGTKTEVSYKGFTAFCIKVYIDGILANNPTTGEFDWNSIDINSIESIVIAEVPQVGISEFAGCSVFITTKDNKSGYLQTETAFSSFEANFMDGLYQSVNYGYGKDKLFYRIGASVVFADNEYDKDTIGQYPDINKYNFSRMGNANLNWNYKQSENWNFSGANSFAYNQVKAFNTGDSLATGIEEDCTTQNSVTATYQKNNLRTQTIGSYFYGQVDYLNKYKRTGSDIDITRLQSAAVRQNISWEFDASFGYRNEHLFTSTGDRNELDFGVSKEFLLKCFTFTPCMQLLAYGPNSQDNWHFEVLPRLTVGITDCVTVSAYRIMTLPTFNQLYWPQSTWAGGNPELDPEQGWACSVAFAKENVPVYLRFTYSYYENKIRWATVDGKLIPANTANADYYVGVLGFEKQLFNNHLVLGADATMTQARLRATGKQIMWVPMYQAHGNIGYNYGGFQAVLDYSWTSKRFKENDNITTYPAFQLLDLNISYQINPEFQIYGKVSNLLDERVPYHDAYYIPSRKWTLGIKIIR